MEAQRKAKDISREPGAAVMAFHMLDSHLDVGEEVFLS